MVNSNQEPTKTREKNEHQNKQQKTAKQSDATTRKAFMPFLAVVVALAALGAATYTFTLNKQLQDQLADKNAQLSIQLDKLAQRQDTVQEQLDIRNKNTEEVRTTLQDKFNDLNTKLDAAMNQRLYQNTNWLLLKARYYLELAQINAHWSKGFSATIALLQQADQMLKQANAPQIFDIRQAIAKDIAQLQALPEVDVAGILSQLDAAQNSVNDLNILPVVNEDKTTTENSAASTNNSSIWRSRLQESMSALGKLIVIRRNDENIKPLISPLFEAVLKENIRLNLQEAQWAVLNNNESVYQLVLKQAIVSIQKNFNTNAQSTTALLKKLAELQQVQLTVTSPEIGSAIPLLNQLIENKESASPQSKPDEQGGNP